MGRLRKTLFLSEMKETDQKWHEITSKSHGRKYQAPYIFYSRTGNAKWREDNVYFDDPEAIREEFKANGYLIK